MKFTRIFGIVLALHVLIISVILVQPGCQTTPDRAGTAPPPEPEYAAEPPPDQSVHPDFNAGLVGQQRTPPSGVRQTPRRPDRPTGFEEPYAREEVLAPVRRETVQPETTTRPPASTYTVQRGDNLIGIARDHNVRLEDLLDLNNLTRESTIYAGQMLQVPAGAAPRGPERDALQYTVRSGDTLSGIANRYGLTVRAIQDANSLASDRIHVGQILALPGAGAPPPPASSTAQPVPDGGAEYVVRSGDTLARIAQRYGVSVSDLRRANDIRGDLIRVGQKLRIPGQAEPETAPEEPPVFRQVPARSPVLPTLEDLERLTPLDDDEIPLVPVDDEQ